jgi:membrane protease subunit HflK
MVLAFGLAVVMNAAAYWWSDRIVLRMHRAREGAPDRAPGPGGDVRKGKVIMATWQQPGPDFPDLGELAERFRSNLPRWGNRRILAIIGAVIVLLWLASGFYVVRPAERGVVLLFGRAVQETEPGLRYRLPWPIHSHHVVDVAQVRRVEVGFRTRGGATQPVPQEGLMLTGDENIVDVHLFIQYLVQDPVKYLFRAVAPEMALHASAEVALRAAVGETLIDYTMTEGRVEVQDRVKRELQALLDLYTTGLLVTEARLLVVDPPREVREAFHDVVRAWEDRERVIKEAEGYSEDVIPKARGEAAQMLQAAEAYREQRLIRAEGDSTRFLRVLDEYRKAEGVTRERLYLETMDRVLPKTNKFILDGGADRGGVLPLLPLRDFVPAPAGAPASEPAEPRANQPVAPDAARR